MFDVIISAINIYNGIYGIGYNNKLPWNSKEEQQLFQDKTDNSILIMDSKTLQILQKLKCKTIICISSAFIENYNNNNITVFNNLQEAFDSLKNCNKKIVVVGGAKIYEEVFTTFYNLIDKVNFSEMKGKFQSDTFITFDNLKFIIEKIQVFNDFIHYTLIAKSSEESNYIKLLKDVYYNGSIKEGRNGQTKSLFGKTLEFDLRNGFPLLTTKKMFFRGIVEELLFFIRGYTDTKILEDKNINIWKGNTNREFLDSINKNDRREAVMGPMYGYQWRHFNCKYDENKAAPIENSTKYSDQLLDVIEKLRKDPHSRRILLTDYNPLQADEGVLFPCHSIIIQFYVNDGYLDMFCFNRSSDLFHGLPFNIASSSLLLILISKITNLIPRKFILSLGDCHIYEEHMNNDIDCNIIGTQISRVPFKFPKLELKKDIKELIDIEKLEYSDFSLNDYESHPPLKAKMIA